MDRPPWDLRSVAGLALVQAAGLAVAAGAGLVAYVGLPPDAFMSSDGEPTGTGTRILAALAAALCCLALPAGCWEAWRRRRHPAPAVLGAVVAVLVGLAWMAWALQLDWG